MYPKVMEAAAVGIHDARRGETVVAFVVLKRSLSATAAELRNFCKERSHG